MKTDQLDWNIAEEHLKEVEGNYRELVGRPGVSIGFAMKFIDQARTKFNRGDRSKELHEEIMSLE